jgi:hypothetical protein
VKDRDMKKKDIWIAVAVIAVTVLGVYIFAERQGHLKIDTPGVELKVRSGWFRTATVSSDSEPVKVAARVYRPERAVITSKKKGESKWWSLQARRGPWGQLERIKVEQDQTTVLKLGPPFTVHTDVRRRGRNASIGLALIGQAGESWNTQVLAGGGQRRPAAPKLQIVDESGNVLVSGKFEYG